MNCFRRYLTANLTWGQEIKVSRRKHWYQRLQAYLM